MTRAKIETIFKDCQAKFSRTSAAVVFEGKRIDGSMRDVFEPSIFPVSGRNMQDPRWRTSRRKVGYEMKSIVFVKILIF